MSKTIRATSGDQYRATKEHSREEAKSTWRRNTETRATYFHSDCFDRDGTGGQFIKAKTSQRRRSRYRAELHKLKKDVDHDFFDIGKSYKSWHFHEDY